MPLSNVPIGRAHREEFGIRAMCRMLRIHVSGFYAWLREPMSTRAKEDARQTALIYYPAGRRPAMSQEGARRGRTAARSTATASCTTICAIKARRARRTVSRGLRASWGSQHRSDTGVVPDGTVAGQRLLLRTGWTASSRSMRPIRPGTRPCSPLVRGQWSSDITYVRTHEGWLYLSVVIDLFSRRVVGWSMQPRMTTELALQALLMAVWRRKLKNTVLVHSGQGSQFSSREWRTFLSQHNLEASMSRRGNCHDNAVAESFFQLLKCERIRRRTYATREAARQDVF